MANRSGERSREDHCLDGTAAPTSHLEDADQREHYVEKVLLTASIPLAAVCMNRLHLRPIVADARAADFTIALLGKQFRGSSSPRIGVKTDRVEFVVGK